ncbi:CU044_2847 family protein [Streptomyces sp. NPDC006134]|uniref:CU044_2847 family protein n=1 Tax=Streptomyces sp. NPDC006134 TaxID=3154467 RepID=UPI0033D94287
MAGGIERIRLDDGTVVWARITAADDAAPAEDGYQDTGVRDRVITMAGGLADTVGGVVRSLRAGLDTTEPVEVGVTFGIELSAQSGSVVSAIAGAGGNASLSVSLTWTEPARQDGRPRPAPADGGAAPDGTPASGAV